MGYGQMDDERRRVIASRVVSHPPHFYLRSSNYFREGYFLRAAGVAGVDPFALWRGRDMVRCAMGNMRLRCDVIMGGAVCV